MSQEALQEIREILRASGTGGSVWLLTFIPLLPESLLLRALTAASGSPVSDLRALIISDLTPLLPEEAQKLVYRETVSPPQVRALYELPMGARVVALVRTLSYEDRFELCSELLDAVEMETRAQIVAREYWEQMNRNNQCYAGGGEGWSRITTAQGESRLEEQSREEEHATASVQAEAEAAQGLEELREDESRGNVDVDPLEESPTGFKSLGEDDAGGGGSYESGAASDSSWDRPNLAALESRDDPSDFDSAAASKEFTAPEEISPSVGLDSIDDDYTSPAMPVDSADAHNDSSMTSAEPPSAGGQEAPPDIVNLGFGPKQHADKRFSPYEALACNSDYYFWVNVGYPLQESAGEGKPLGVDKLPKEARLQVALFSFEGELQITPRQDVGELQIQQNGKVKVSQQPIPDPSKISLSPLVDPGIFEYFLFFPVRTPEKEGTHRLRCNFYCGQMLVQSHLITAYVGREPANSEKAVDAVVDYSLSEKLSPANLAALAEQPHLMSMMLNQGEDGSYNIRFFGGNAAEGVGLVKDDAPIDADEIKGFLKWARSAMHKVAWNNEDEWDPKNLGAYRYAQGGFDAAKLAKDLAYLARAGKRIYAGILDNLKVSRAELEKLMSTSGLVQIALKLSPPAVLPAAIIYDYAWKPEAFVDFDNTPFTLCETFQAGIEAANKGLAKLDQCLCFKGQCSLKAKIKAIQDDPNKNLKDLPPIICPSGFWGYRHALGFPLTLAKGLDANPVITYDDKLRVVAAVSTDPGLVERDKHIERLKVLTKVVGLDRDESYDGIVKRLKGTKPHVIYFYCHGGVRLNGVPYLEVGKADQWVPETLSDEGISWSSNPRPLVFINGCHTTSLNPEIALNFVTPLVQLGGASGVIGTEITIFEPLAVKFAEECLQRFLGAPPYDGGMPIGEAVRGARLELLRLGNPLGLVYIPFVLAGLRMVNAANPN